MEQLALEWIGRYGYIGVFSLLTLGIVGIPIPDEWLLALLGYLVFKHILRFPPALAAAFAGTVCGISVSYACGYTFGSYLIEKYGSFIHLTRDRVEKVRQWFNRLGRWALFFGYFIPGGCHLTAYVAGTSRVQFRVFARFAYSGALIWSIAFVSLGYVWSEYSGGFVLNKLQDSVESNNALNLCTAAAHHR
jgi:membrane protein DedA with SNARE-associated domain